MRRHGRCGSCRSAGLLCRWEGEDLGETVKGFWEQCKCFTGQANGRAANGRGNKILYCIDSEYMLTVHAADGSRHLAIQLGALKLTKAKAAQGREGVLDPDESHGMLVPQTNPQCARCALIMSWDGWILTG